LRTISAALLSVALGLFGCVPKADLDKANVEVEQLTTKVAQLEKANAELEAKLNRKPSMPVKVSLRKPIIGTGYVAVFATTVKQDFPILVTIKSKALGTAKQVRVNLSGLGTTELGSTDGIRIDPEDELLLENTHYESATVKFQN